MRSFLFLFIFLFFSSVVFAQSYPLISDGSFEENCALSKCDYNVSQTIGDDWIFSKNGAANVQEFTITQDLNSSDGWPSHGSYYGKLDANSIGGFAQIQSTFVFNGGIIYYDVNHYGGAPSFPNPPFSGAHFQITYTYEDGSGEVTLLDSNTNLIGLDRNVVLPNHPGKVSFKLTNQFQQQHNTIVFDNLRWRRLPVIETDSYPFDSHVYTGQSFFVDINFSTGASCQLKDDSTGQSYSATYIGNGIYRSSGLSFSSTGSSLVKNFSAICNSETNDDSFYLLKLNRDGLISQNGGFDVNGTPSTTTSTNTKFQDWNVGRSGTGSFAVIIDNSSSKIAADGLHYGIMTATGIGSATDITSQSLLQGGTVFFDVNRITGPTLGDSNFQVIYFPLSGGSTVLLNLSFTIQSSQIVGSDKNVSIPNQLGHLLFRVQNVGVGQNAQLYLDNVRYSSPKFSENTSCKQVIYKGDSSQKIDLVFVGSGFEDQNQFESTIRFVINEDGDQNGLFSFEPFKSNINKFNIWMVDEYKTYTLHHLDVSPIIDKWTFGPFPLIDATIACPFGNEFALLSLYPRFRSYVDADANSASYTGKPAHFAHVGLGGEIVGDLNYPIDVGITDPYDQNCQGNGQWPACGISAYDPNDSQRLFAHEFGHSFGGLFDEYNNGSSSNGRDTGTLANCDATNICPKFSGYSGIDCNAVCGFTNWYRPYAENTLMGDHRKQKIDYEEVSEDRLTAITNGYSTATIYDQTIDIFHTFILNGAIGAGNMDLSSVNFVPGAAPEMVLPTNPRYMLKEFSSTNDVLYDYNFDIPSAINFDLLSGDDANGSYSLIEDSNTLIDLVDVNFSVRAPYLPGAVRIIIYDINGTQLLEISTLPFTTNLSTSIGYGGGFVTSANYKVGYSLLQQPTVDLNSSSYKVQLGWNAYYD